MYFLLQISQNKYEFSELAFNEVKILLESQNFNHISLFTLAMEAS